MNNRSEQQETTLARLGNAIVKVDAQIASLMEKLRKHDKDAMLFDQCFTDNKQKIDKQLHNDTNQLSDNDLQKKIANLQKELSDLNRKMSVLELEYQKLETKKQKQQRAVNQVESQIQTLQSARDKLATEIENRGLIMDIVKWIFGDEESEQKVKLESQIQNTKSQKDKLLIVLRPLQADVDHCQTKQQNIRIQQQSIQNREKSARFEIETLHKKVMKLQENHAESQRILKENQKIRLTELQLKRKQLVADFQSGWNRLVQPIDDVVKEVRAKQPALDQLSERSINTTASGPTVLAFGRLRVVRPENKELPKWHGLVPRLLNFPFQKPLYAEFDKESDSTLINQLLLRLLFALPIRTVEVTAIDPLNMGRSLAPFLSLTDTEEIVPHKKFLTRSDEIESALQNLLDYVENLLQKRFQRDVDNWTRYNAAYPNNKLPYKLIFIFGFPDQFSDKSVLYLKRLIKYGPQCGVLLIITLNRSLIDPKRAAGEIPTLLENNARQIYHLYSTSPLSQLKYLKISEEDEPFPDSNKLSEYLHWIQTEYKQHNQFSKQITDMWTPQQLAKSNSADGISTPIGWTAEGKEVALELGGVQSEHHVLLAGRSGSGKSNLLHVLIHGFVHRYSSDELNVYLLDYKEGVEFNVYANQLIPQIKLVATESDTEYGITVLDYLCGELQRRAALFKKGDVRDIQEYRNKSGEKLPRVLLIIDEFQLLFQNNDALTKRADECFNLLLRQGRSNGIHILLATQTLKGLQSVTSIGQLISQIGSRIALACNQEDSALILTGNNWEAANLKSPPEGIINNSSGQKSGNIRFNIPYADMEIGKQHLGSIEKIAQQNGFVTDTKVFNGTRLPLLPSPAVFSSCCIKAPQILLGEELNFSAKPFVFNWERRSGNNLCIVGLDDSIRQGLLRSLLTCIKQNQLFDNLVYYNTNPYNTMDISEIGGIVLQNHTWDGNISELISDCTTKRSLLIIDAMDAAKMFHPKPATFGAKKDTVVTPADSLKTLLDEGPIHGSFVIAFVDNWKRFSTTCKDYQNLFELRIGFSLNEEDAGNLVSGGTVSRFKGLDSGNKAIFVDRQKNRQVWFRPFIVSTEE